MERLFHILDIGLLKESAYTMRNGKFAAFICRSGSAQMYIDDKFYLVERNVMCIFVPYTVVRVVEYSADWDGLLIEEGFDFILTTIIHIPISKRQAVRTSPCMKASQEQSDRLWRLLNATIERDEVRYKTEKNGGDSSIMHDVVQHLIQALALELMDIYYACTPVEDLPLSKVDQIYNRFIVSVFTHCHRERTVAYYAREQNLSPGHFSLIIRKQSGQNAMKSIEEVVMMQIRHMLRDPNLSIKEISNRMNFPDQSAFGRFFKTHEGVSPSEYRNKI